MPTNRQPAKLSNVLAAVFRKPSAASPQPKPPPQPPHPNRSEPIRTQPNPTEPSGDAISSRDRKYFYPAQAAWIEDQSPLKIIQKARQVGITGADAYDSVKKASHHGALFDVWVTSRDEAQAKLYLEDCKHWACLLHLLAV